MNMADALLRGEIIEVFVSIILLTTALGFSLLVGTLLLILRSELWIRFHEHHKSRSRKVKRAITAAQQHDILRGQSLLKILIQVAHAFRSRG